MFQMSHSLHSSQSVPIGGSNEGLGPSSSNGHHTLLHHHTQPSSSSSSSISTSLPDNASSSGDSHSKTVQALRQFLQKKRSSEDSGSESPQNANYPESDPGSSSAGTPHPLLKQRSLPEDPSRYLRTDLCIPILLCPFCSHQFESDAILREHIMRDHQAQFNAPYPHPIPIHHHHHPQNQEEALDLSLKKGAAGSLPNLHSSSSSAGAFTRKHHNPMNPIIKCQTCGKSFSTKWNWKQHQKIHLREHLLL